MDYHVTVGKVMTLLKEKGVCSSSQKSHKECYFSLGSFLDRTGQEYSETSRNEWRSLISNEYPRQRCTVWNQYVFQLEEMSAYSATLERPYRPHMNIIMQHLNIVPPTLERRAAM